MIESVKIESLLLVLRIHRPLIFVTKVCTFPYKDHNTSRLFAKLSQNEKQKKSNEIIRDRRQSSALALKFQKA